MQRRALQGVFDDYRSEGIAALELLPGIESVDRFVLEDDTLSVSLTSDYSTDGVNTDLAWQISRGLAPLWDADGLFSRVTFPVAIEVDVSSVSARCPGDFMLRLADHRDCLLYTSDAADE